MALRRRPASRSPEKILLPVLLRAAPASLRRRLAAVTGHAQRLQVLQPAQPPALGDGAHVVHLPELKPRPASRQSVAMRSEGLRGAEQQ